MFNIRAGTCKKMHVHLFIKSQFDLHIFIRFSLILTFTVWSLVNVKEKHTKPLPSFQNLLIKGETQCLTAFLNTEYEQIFLYRRSLSSATLKVYDDVDRIFTILLCIPENKV